MKASGMVRTMKINEAGWLSHVDNLRESFVKEGIIDIKLSNGPSMGDSKGKNSMNSCFLTIGLNVSSKSTPWR